jgi:ABC-2 type transport system permease protein
MKKLIQIAWSEYRRRVARRSFILVLLLPLILLAFSVVVGFISASTAINSDRGVVGYIDPSAALKDAVMPPADADNTFRLFTDVESARAALEQKEILAYFVLAPDFASTGKANFYYWQNEPGKAVKRNFEHFARTALVDGNEPQITSRLLAGTTFNTRTPDGARSYDEDNPVSIIFPLFVAVLFIIALFGGASYLLQAVVDEKENRTIEIVVTSVTPMQLMSGKIVGLAAVGLTQIAVWLSGGSIALALLRDRIEFLQGATLDPWFIILAIVLMVLQYIVYGAIMAGIGSIVVDQKQGQSLSSPFTMIAMIPLFFIAVIIFDPNGTLSVILSLFPLTAPLAILLRYGMTNVPLWQILLAIVLQALTAVGAMWLAARIFRIGMLRFGQRVSLSEIAASIRF